MIAWRARAAWLGILGAACGGHHSGNAADGMAPVGRAHATTSGAIAVANLDQLLAQRGDEPGVEDLLLARSRFLADAEALDRASELAEARRGTAAELVTRARTRSAAHRFGDALADLAAAQRAGGRNDEIMALRASIFVATGRAAEVVPQLEAAVARHPDLASHSALAGAYAMVGRIDDADRLYVAALADLDTTSPFPYAWVYFARGLLWAESGREPARGEQMYARALAHLPGFVAANVHLAELEAARGDLITSMARLERVLASTAEPEALGLLGELHIRTGDRVRGQQEIAHARARFERLLARHPLAFADHAAEFYLGPGADPERAWVLAQDNLAGRQTGRAFALAIDAARATGRRVERCALVGRARAAGVPVATADCQR